MAIPRPDDFFSRLSQCTTLDKAKAEIDSEYAYLSSELLTLASLKSGFTTYRNFFRYHDYAHPSLNNGDLSKIFFERFTLTLPQLETFKKNHKKQIISDMENLKPIKNVAGFIDTSISLLQSHSYIDMILGLCALTGRRSAEIATSAEFTYVDPHTILFHGQLKVKERQNVKPYSFPCLHKAEILVKCLSFLRQSKPQFINDTTRFHNACSKDLSRKAKEIFDPLFSFPVKTKDLRSIYAEICFKLFNENKRLSRSRYYAQILGHDELDIVTAQSYDDFRIEDPSFST